MAVRARRPAVLLESVCDCVAVTTYGAKRNRLVHAALGCSLALSLAVATGGEADAARKGVRPCQPAGSKTVAASGTARVYTRRGPKRAGADPSTVISLYGCRAQGRPVRMATRAVFSAGTLSFRLEQPAGRFASVVTSSDDRGGYSDELEVYDLRRRRRTSRISPAQEARVRDVVLMPSGNVAWIQTAPSEGQALDEVPQFNSFEVGARQGGKTVLLDSGRGIDPRSLASSGSILYWTNGARASTARLP